MHITENNLSGLVLTNQRIVFKSRVSHLPIREQHDLATWFFIIMYIVQGDIEFQITSLACIFNPNGVGNGSALI